MLLRATPFKIPRLRDTASKPGLGNCKSLVYPSQTPFSPAWSHFEQTLQPIISPSNRAAAAYPAPNTPGLVPDVAKDAKLCKGQSGPQCPDKMSAFVWCWTVGGLPPLCVAHSIPPLKRTRWLWTGQFWYHLDPCNRTLCFVRAKGVGGARFQYAFWHHLCSCPLTIFLSPWLFG